MKNYNKATLFLHWIRQGEKYGYPKCCIMAFAKDCVEDKHPAILRGGFAPTVHVPCKKCVEKWKLAYRGLPIDFSI